MAYRHPRPPTKQAPHIALWMLRLITSHEVLRRFVCKGDFGRDDIAYALGLDHWIDPEDRPFNPQAVRAELYQQLSKAQRACAQQPLPALLQDNVQRLATLVGLSAVDARILAFAVCLHNEPMLDETADMLEQLTTTQVIKTVAMLLDLPDAQVRQALGSQGLLARSGLVVVDRSGSGRLKSKLEMLSHTFADQMVSTDADPIHLLRGKIQPAAPGHLALTDYGHIKPTLDIVRPWLHHAQCSQRRGVNLYVHGAPGTGKTELARALAQDLGCDLFEVASEDDDGDPISPVNRLRAFRAAQSFLAQRKALLLFDEVEDVFHDSPLERGTAQSHKAWLNRMLEDNPVPTLWLSNSGALDSAFIRRFDMVFELPVPPQKQRARIIAAQCAGLLDAPAIARLSAVETLAPAVVARAAQVLRRIDGALPAAHTGAALERLVDSTLQAQGHAPLARHDATHLPEVYDPAFIAADADLAAIAQGIAAHKNARLCLYGPPGTGKTAYGRWLAQELDMPLLVKRASDLQSMYLGECEKNLARAFRAAEQDGALLLIDEVDSFLQDRQGAQRSWEVSQVNEMLTQMESFSGVFIATTNLMHGLDQAALRRFDLKVKLDFLRPEQAWALLQRHCVQLGLAAPGMQEQARLARLRQLTPGDFAAVLRQGRFKPLADAAALVAGLEGECALKDGAKGVMGFV